MNGARRRRAWQLGIAAGILVSIGVALVASPARPVAYVVAPVGGAVLTIMAAGLGRRRTLVGVWHDAWHPDGVERRLLGVATGALGAERILHDAARRPGFTDATAGLSLRPEAVGVLEAAETWQLWRQGRRARLDNDVDRTAWFVTDAADPFHLLPGDSALGFATSARSAELLVRARRAESLRDPGAVRTVEVRIGADLWPDGVPGHLRAARPLDHHDPLLG